MFPQQYRDLVISVYLNAVDARYLQFRQSVGSEGRGGAIGADLAVIALTTGASVIEKSATELSAAAAAFAGGKATINTILASHAFAALLSLSPRPYKIEQAGYIQAGEQVLSIYTVQLPG